MITQAVINFFANIFASLLGLVPSFTLPAWYYTMMPFWASFFETAEGFRVWIPFDAVKNVLAFSLVVFGVIIAIRVFRVMLSLFTGGGGSAA